MNLINLFDTDKTIESVNSPCNSIALLFKALRRIMKVSTIAMLVPEEYEKSLKIIYIDTSVQGNPLKNTCGWGEGLLGGVFAQDGIFVANDLASRKWNVPYFRNPVKIHSFLAVSSGSSSPDHFFILCLERTERIPFSKEETEAVRNIATVMKAIIENAQKQDLLQEDIERAKKIFNFNTIIQEATTLEGASESILNVFSSFCSAKSIFFTIWNSISEDFEIIGGLGKDATEAKRIKHHEGDDLISLSIKLNRPLPENGVFRENIQSVISGARFPWVKDGDPFLVVPFVLKSIPLGAVIIVGLKDFSFTKEIVDCAKSIAMVASNSLHSLKIYEILEKRAVTDELTGLYNKRNFLMRLDEVFADSIRHNKLFSLLIGDLDYFKKINDEYGHITGDRVLKAAAMIIKETARKSDIVARYGGEEFAVIIPETDIDGGKAAAERIRQALERTKVPGPTSLIDISISFGIASFPKDGRNTQEIIGKADKALYKAKKEGRNRVCV